MEQNHNMLRGISENGGIVFYGVDSVSYTHLTLPTNSRV